LASVSFGHTERIGKRVIVLGGGNTAMDCCRSSRRLGGEDVKVIVRSGFEEMKASPWEKEDAQHEGIPILNFLVPKAFLHKNGKLTGMTFEKVKAVYDDKGRRSLVPTGEPDQHFDCDDVLIAVGQANAFPWIERDAGIAFDGSGMPMVDKVTMQSTHSRVFFGGDAAFGPKNIIWAVAHGHDAAISIDKACNGEDMRIRPAPMVNLVSQKMGIHEWSYDNDISTQLRHRVPLRSEHRAEKHQGRSRTRLRPADRLRRGATLPQLRRADGVHCAAMHRMRRLRGHLPDGLHHLHRQRRGAGTARAVERAGQEPVPGSICFRCPQDRPHHGQGRGRVSALRAVRRALPDRRLGHAEVPPRHDARGVGLPRAAQKSRLMNRQASTSFQRHDQGSCVIGIAHSRLP
jgi:hypothetical protein